MLFLIWLIVDVYDQAQPWWPYFDQWIFIKFFCFYFSFGPFSFFLGSKLSIYFFITSIHIILGFPPFFFLLFFIFPLPPPPPPHSKLFMSLCNTSEHVLSDLPCLFFIPSQKCILYLSTAAWGVRRESVEVGPTYPLWDALHYSVYSKQVPS